MIATGKGTATTTMTKNKLPEVGKSGTRRKRRSSPTVKVEFTYAEPSPEAEVAWRRFIDFLVGAAIRKAMAEAGLSEVSRSSSRARRA
jgi:hypothetical protein